MCGVQGAGGAPRVLTQPLAGSSTGGGGAAVPATSASSALASLSSAIQQLQQSIAAIGGAPTAAAATVPTAVAGAHGIAATGGQGMAILPGASLVGGASGEDDTFEARVLDLVNQQRAQYGLAPVRYNAQLDAAARGHAAQMGATGTMSHDGIGDGDPGSRIRAAGFGGAWGENVAVGQSTPEQVVAEWMASPTHRANILSPTFAQLGVEAVTGADGRQYWAQAFGS